MRARSHSGGPSLFIFRIVRYTTPPPHPYINDAPPVVAHTHIHRLPSHRLIATAEVCLYKASADERIINLHKTQASPYLSAHCCWLMFAPAHVFRIIWHRRRDLIVVCVVCVLGCAAATCSPLRAYPALTPPYACGRRRGARRPRQACPRAVLHHVVHTTRLNVPPTVRRCREKLRRVIQMSQASARPSHIYVRDVCVVLANRLCIARARMWRARVLRFAIYLA